MDKKKSISKQSQMLYNPSAKVIEMTLKIEETMKHKKRTIVKLPKSVKLGGLNCTRIELDTQGCGVILVHWEPNFQISTQTDPYCSALILKYNTLCKLLRIITALLS